MTSSSPPAQNTVQPVSAEMLDGTFLLGMISATPALVVIAPVMPAALS